VNDRGGDAKSAREVKQSRGAYEPLKFHRPQITPCSDVANYPASAAFFISTYKIYAVYPAKKYKSNRVGWSGLDDAALLGAIGGNVSWR
jgi:hypothetical protein